MESLTYNVSVRDLVAFSIPGEESRGFSLNSSAKEGIEGHQFMHSLLKQQTGESGSYQKEVSVAFPFIHENCTLQISGRLDGMLDINGHISICEIKTTEKSLNMIEQSENPSYWAQGQCYAYMVARKKALDKITLILIYFHRLKKDYRTFEETFTFSKLEKIFHSLVIPYINGIKKQSEWQNTRNLSIQSLCFPCDDFRKGQRAMSASVYRAIRDRNKQFIQAPTGIGKTLGSLFPALKAMGEGLVDKIFYLTARNTTQAIAVQAYEMMAEKGLRLKVLQITAKEKVCLSPDTVCNPEDCKYLSDYARKSRAVISNIIKEKDFFNREVIDTAAREYSLCPFEFSLDLSLRADLILCDYNYVFDPRIYLKRFFQDKIKDRICFIIDEAHNLPDRAREMYSTEIKRSQFKNIYNQIRKELPDLAAELKKARKAFLKYIRELPLTFEEIGLPCAWSVPDPPDNLIKPIENFLYDAEEVLNDESFHSFKEELITFFFDLVHFTRIYELYGENYTTFLYREKGEFILRLYCIDPAPMLKKRMACSISSILFSATLSPPVYFKEVLGGEDKDGYLIIPSPFPRDNLYIYIEDTVSTKYRYREESVPAVIRCIYDAVSVKTGNYMVFFPSFSYMNRVAFEYRKQYPDDKILIQETIMNEEERTEFLSRFMSFGESTLIAFAVMGGIFGEGIDLKGELLSGAIIIGVGLPQICPERDIIKNYYQRKTGCGFDFAYTYPGLNKVQQAAGRVIRSERDRGFIILMDERFTAHLYRSILPSEWFPFKTPGKQKDLSLDLKKFWGYV